MKKFLSLTLAMLMIIASLTAVFTVTSFAADDDDEDDEGVITPDTSWYNASQNEFEISTAAQFLGFGVLLNGTDDAEAVTFKGKTIKLTADIDLNPGWNADEYWNAIIDDELGLDGYDMTIAYAPANVWAVGNGRTGGNLLGSFVKFEGTLDGQNHYVSGMFRNSDTNIHDMSFFGGASLDNAAPTVVKNLAIVNSFLRIVGARGAGLFSAGSVEITNVYNGMYIYATRTDSGVGGFLGCVGWSGYNANINDKASITSSVFAGTIFGATTSAGKGDTITGFVNSVEGKQAEVTLRDCLMCGELWNGLTQTAFLSCCKAGITMESCVSYIKSTYAPFNNNLYYIARDIRFGKEADYPNVAANCSGLLYVTSDGGKAPFDFSRNADTKEYEPELYGVPTTAYREATVAELKTLNTGKYNSMGFNDWTSELETDGIKMPISSALAATVVSYTAPEGGNDSAGGDDGNNAGTDNGNNSNNGNTTTDTEATETKADETKASTDTEAEETKKGCGSVIGASAIVIMAVTGTALAIGAKKKEN